MASTEAGNATSGPVIVQSGGLCPSNRGAGFPNLARSEPFSDAVVEEVTAACVAEMESAGIAPYVFGHLFGKSEVPSKAMGQFGMWGFKRAWYYWVAEGPGLPVEVAERLHAEHGRAVRVSGHCGCPSPREWYKGFGVGSYHVDSQEGLKALVDALRSVYDPATDPDVSPRTGKQTP